ncbi:uncharacterized protein [Aegilops tauschii subsp. strangulata]|uniref:uncharacterized protein n=1 Tax=Aegilops tauschii subsp. strangulata TaxID=200361 RepID=UPI003CC8D880
MPFTYLGLPLGTTKPTVLDMAPMVCKAERRITAAMSLMSYAGKLALVNSLITALAIYPMGTLKLPPKIIEQLNKIRRYCLWKKKTEDAEKCTPLAAWDMICRPKKCGGLGVLNLRIQNEALLLKMLRKFYNHHDIPWVNLIWHSYYNGLVPHAAKPSGSFRWKDLIKLMPTYRGVTTVRVNSGDTALFWKDMWNNSIYTTSFPRAFSFAANEDISVQQFLATMDLAATFRLPLSMQAQDELRQIQREVSHFTLDGSKDQWICTWGAQIFKTSAYYTFVFRDVQAHEGFRWLWKAKSIPKIKVFGWFLLSDRLNTCNMLNR